MDDRPLQILFPDATSAEAGRMAGELRDSLKRLAQARGVSGSISLEVKRTNEDALDFGTTLVVLLGTPAVAVLAKGVHDFVAKLGSRVTIVTLNGTVVATGDGAARMDIAATTAALIKVHHSQTV